MNAVVIAVVIGTVIAAAAPTRVLRSGAQTSTSSRPAPLELSSRELDAGIEWLAGTASAGSRSVKLNAVRVSLGRYRISIGVPDAREQGDVLSSYLDHYGALAVISGGFLKSFYPPIPLGFVMRARTVVNRATRDDLLTGLLTVRNGRPFIGPFSETAAAGADDGLQSGPLLVQGGQSALPKSDGLTTTTRALIERASERAFVAVLPDDRVLIGHTEPATLADLVSVLTKAAAVGGLGCVDALNLSGSTGAGLLVKAGGSELAAGSQQLYLPNAILVNASRRSRR
jgi:Phosphodiester glycosidase